MGIRNDELKRRLNKLFCAMTSSGYQYYPSLWELYKIIKDLSDDDEFYIPEWDLR